MPKIEKRDALQAHPEFLNEKIDDHDKAIYAKGWNDCNKEYYNAITELPVASMASCTDLSTRLRRAFEADELVNQRLLLDAADAIEELQAQVPHWISVEERLPEHYRVVLVIKDHPVDYLHGYEFAARLQNGEWSGNSRKVLFWMPLPEPPEVRS